jgi:hypothetical protein
MEHHAIDFLEALEKVEQPSSPAHPSWSPNYFTSKICYMQSSLKHGSIFTRHLIKTWKYLYKTITHRTFSHSKILRWSDSDQKNKRTQARISKEISISFIIKFSCIMLYLAVSGFFSFPFFRLFVSSPPDSFDVWRQLTPFQRYQ